MLSSIFCKLAFAQYNIFLWWLLFSFLFYSFLIPRCFLFACTWIVFSIPFVSMRWNNEWFVKKSPFIWFTWLWQSYYFPSSSFSYIIISFLSFSGSERNIRKFKSYPSFYSSFWYTFLLLHYCELERWAIGMWPIRSSKTILSKILKFI